MYVSNFEGKKISIWENGQRRVTKPGSYQVGDVITITQTGTKVCFYHNEVLITCRDKGTTNDLYFDSSIYTPGTIIEKISDWN